MYVTVLFHKVFLGGTSFSNCICNNYFYLIENAIIYSFVYGNGFTSTIHTQNIKVILKSENVVATRWLHIYNMIINPLKF